MSCPDLELLFNELADGHGPALEHAASCPACAALVEEHRQLEKDLFRLADPLPPANLVSQVMAKVQQAPAPMSTEIRAAALIVLVALGLTFASFLARGIGLAQIGADLASLVLNGRAVLLALGSAMAAAWRTSALPLAIGLSFLLALSLVGLKRAAGSEVKVLS